MDAPDVPTLRRSAIMVIRRAVWGEVMRGRAIRTLLERGAREPFLIRLRAEVAPVPPRP